MAAEIPVKGLAGNGDVRRLWSSAGGRIRTYAGDALLLLAALPDRSVDMVMMDPPYGHNNNDGDLIGRQEAALGRPGLKKAAARPISNDGPEATELLERIVRQVSRLLRHDGCCCCCCCCCGGGGPDPQFARWCAILDRHLRFQQMVIWDKGPMGMGWHYRRSYETVLVASRSNVMRWFDRTHRIENIIRPGDYGIRKIIPSERQHPTEKPIALAEHFLRLHIRVGDVVLDPFMGRGWSGIASAWLRRRYVGIELDVKWAAEATARIRNAATGSSRK